MKITINKDEGLEIIRAWAKRNFADEKSGMIITNVRLPNSYSCDYEIEVEPKPVTVEGETDAGT